VLDLEPHALLVDPHLPFHPGPALGLLQPKLVFPDARYLPLLLAPDSLLFLSPPGGLLFTAPLLLGLARGPLGVRTGPSFVLFLADSIVFDPTKLPQRKQNGVLTTLGHGCLSYGAALTRARQIDVTRFNLDFNAPGGEISAKSRRNRVKP
jgi:hypothetical protein